MKIKEQTRKLAAGCT